MQDDDDQPPGLVSSNMTQASMRDDDDQPPGLMSSEDEQNELYASLERLLTEEEIERWKTLRQGICDTISAETKCEVKACPAHNLASHYMAAVTLDTETELLFRYRFARKINEGVEKAIAAGRACRHLADFADLIVLLEDHANAYHAIDLTGAAGKQQHRDWLSGDGQKEGLYHLIKRVVAVVRMSDLCLDILMNAFD